MDDVHAVCQNHIWQTWLIILRFFLAERPSPGVLQRHVKVELPTDGSPRWVCPLPFFSLSPAWWKTTKARTSWWKLIETSAGLSKASSPGPGTRSGGHRKWLIAGMVLISYSQSHIPLPDVLYKRWWVRCIPYEPHQWMSTCYAWPRRNRVHCQTLENRNNVTEQLWN